MPKMSMDHLVSVLQWPLKMKGLAAMRKFRTSTTLMSSTFYTSNTTSTHKKIEYNSNLEGAVEDRKLYLKHFKHFITPQTTLEATNNPRLGLFFEHFKKALEYNVPHGKMVRTLPLAVSYKFFKENPEEVTEEEIFLYNIIAWCFEAVHSYTLITDDIVDGSPTRRQRQSWHMKDHIGLSAINDAFSMHAGACKVLRTYFRYEPYYLKALELINEHCWNVSLGQTLDIILQVDKPSKYSQLKDLHTMDNFVTCLEYKTAGTFWPPLAMAMSMNGIRNLEVYNEMQEIIRTVGRLYQYQNDGVDIYGNPNKARTGTDVEDGKCTIFSVSALQMGDSRQVKIIQDNLGRKDPECAKRVKEVYLELGFPEMCDGLNRSICNDVFNRLKKLQYTWAERWFKYSIGLFFEDELLLAK